MYLTTVYQSGMLTADDTLPSVVFDSSVNTCKWLLYKLSMSCNATCLLTTGLSFLVIKLLRVMSTCGCVSCQGGVSGNCLCVHVCAV